MIRQKNGMLLVVFVLPICFSAGCGYEKVGEHTVYPVSGQVLYQGKPLPGAYVGFNPDDQSLPGAFGRTNEQGQFTLRTDNRIAGAVAGSFKVVVRKSEGGSATGEEVTDPKIGAKLQPKSAIPPRYADPNTSGLTARVTPEGSNDFTFKLE